MKTLFENTKELLINKLYEYEGSDYYASELTDLLFEKYNTNGCVFMDTEQEKEFIFKNYVEFDCVCEILKENYAVSINPFEKPHELHVLAAFEVANAILYHCDLINENCDDLIELTPQNIEILKTQIEAVFSTYQLTDLL